MAKDEKKKSFLFYFDYREHLKLLTDEERGKLLMALLDYGEFGIEPELDGAARMAFSFMALQIKRDFDKYARISEARRAAGRQGGRPQKASEDEEKQNEAKKANAFEEKQNEAKKPDTETETDTVTETDTDTGTDTETIINNCLSETPQGGTPDGVPAEAAESTPYSEIIEIYHSICKSYPKLKIVSSQRKKAISARWKEHKKNLETFRELFEKAEASDFMKGKNAKGWTADFNWLMNSDNMAKVLEGKYDNKNGGQNRAGNISNIEQAKRTENSGNAPTLSGFRMADA